MKKSMPRIGMRIIKTSIAAFLILLIFTAVGAKRSPFYVLITTIICIQPDIANTKDTAFNRAIGTLIGAVTGAVAMLLEMPLKGLPGGELWWDLLNAVMICIQGGRYLPRRGNRQPGRQLSHTREEAQRCAVRGGAG